MNPITVLLADDHTIVREGVRRMLELDSGLQVVGEAQTGRQAVRMAIELRPAVVLMDIAMPELNGLEATRQLLKAIPTIKILILSAHNDPAYVATAITAGASGFLLKQTSSHEVCQAIHDIHDMGHFGGRSSEGHNPKPFPQRRRGPKTAGRAPQPLTSREVEVLQLIAEGKPNKATASELGIGIKTVEKHREHIMAKLGIHDTAGLTRYSIAAGIIESGVQVTIL